MIGIVTINDPQNYGNRLQNYALSQLLKKYGNNTTIYLNFADTRLQVMKVALKRMIVHPVRNWFGRVFGSNQDIRLTEKRRHVFDVFTKRYVADNLLHVNVAGGMSPGIKKLRYIVVGSDQVWNDHWLNNQSSLEARLAGFAAANTQIISYAASFSTLHVENESVPIFKKLLPHFKAISVREFSAKTLVKELSGCDSTVVLDPTLMISSDKWLDITRGFVPDNDKYVLTYFLGKPSGEQERTIHAYAKSRGCGVRRIMDPRDKESLEAGPQDFVELFSKAQYVFTDSYHACCFSILFHRQFTVFNRAGIHGQNNMNTRMETLFQLFDLDSAVVDDGLSPSIDYVKVEELLGRHRSESRKWLDRAMGERF